MTDIAADCQRGCLLTGQHIPDCTCNDECADHNSHCEGCLPRPSDIGHYCERCATRLRDTLNELPPLILATRNMPGGRLFTPINNGDATRRATKVTQQTPSPAHDAADEAERWANDYAVALADELNERGPFQYRIDGIPVPNADESIRYITNRLTHVCASPYANELTDEASQFRARLTRATAGDEADQRIPTPCPRCNLRTLIRRNGTEQIECRNDDCAAVWYADEYERLADSAAS